MGVAASIGASMGQPPGTPEKSATPPLRVLAWRPALRHCRHTARRRFRLIRNAPGLAAIGSPLAWRMLRQNRRGPTGGKLGRGRRRGVERGALGGGRGQEKLKT